MESKYLPEEMLREIFLRLPGRSVLRFRCVCKSFRNLIDNPSFHSMHHELSCFIDGKFKLGPKITTGRFFHLYSGTNIQTGQDVTIMLESVNTKIPWLLRESKLYTRLRGGWGIPNSQWFGVQGGYNALVTDPLGTSLEDLFNRCNRKFTLKTVLMLVYFLISRVEAMHLKGYVHRDIGPANFFIRNKQIRIANYTVAKNYIDPQTHEHIPYRENKNRVGVLRFSSLNSDIGIEQSRRDDLESLGYMLVYFLKGSLPWQKYESMRIWHRDEKIADKKMSTAVEVLCQSLPQEFAAYFFYCRSLRFDEKPDYAYLRRRFSDAFRREGYQFDYSYDWITLKDPQKGSESSGEVGSSTGPSTETTEKLQLQA